MAGTPQSHEDFTAAFDALRAAWRRLARDGGRLLEADGIYAVATGAPFPACNQAFIWGPGDRIEAAAGECERFFLEEDLPFVLQVEDEVAPESLIGLEGRGRAPLMVLPGARAAVKPVEGLVVEPVRGRDGLARMHEVCAAGFGAPVEAMKPFLRPWMVEAEDVELLLGVVDGTAVGSAMGIIDGDAVGIFSVATVGSHRRRGIGAAMTAAACMFGVSRGARLAYLQASEMGLSVYAEMGFEVVGHHRLYARAASV